ncbi:MAG: hypothetical protein ACE5KT_12640 [Methanosarcinales archaeon]
MADPKIHLNMSEKYHKRAIADFHTAESLEDLEDKVCYFGSSAEFLLLSLDHLLGWFTRSDEFTSRRSRWNCLDNHGKFKRLSQDKKNKVDDYGEYVEYVRNKLLYLQIKDLNDAIDISKFELKPLLKGFDNVSRIIRGLRQKSYRKS